MIKNTAGQKARFLAFNATTGLKVTGDAANITAYLSKDHGAPAALADTTATEIDATKFPGEYWFDVSQAESNATSHEFSAVSTTANVVLVYLGCEVAKPANSDVLSIDSSGVVKSNQSQILGTALTETGAGYLAAAFKKLFDVAVPALTAASKDQSGDAYAKVNDGTYGNAALLTAIQNIQNNTRCVRQVPVIIERPDSGTQTYRIELLLYDEVGSMEAPDSAPTIALVNQAGTDLSSRLDSATMSLVSTGRYRAVYTASVGDSLDQLVWTFSVVEGGMTRAYGNTTLIVDTTAVDFTSADRTKLESILTQTGTAGVVVGSYASGMSPASQVLANASNKLYTNGDGQVDLIDAPNADAIAAISAALNTLIYGYSVETGVSFLGLLRVLLSLVGGITDVTDNGDGTYTTAFMRKDGTTTAMTITTSDDGRISVTYGTLS